MRGVLLAGGVEPGAGAGVGMPQIVHPVPIHWLDQVQLGRLLTCGTGRPSGC